MNTKVHLFPLSRLSVAICVLTMSLGSLSAQTTFQPPGVSGDYNDPSNWSAGVPDGNEAIIQGGKAAELNTTPATSIATLSLNGGYLVSGADFTVTNTIRGSANGALLVTGGTLTMGADSEFLGNGFVARFEGGNLLAASTNGNGFSIGRGATSPGGNAESTVIFKANSAGTNSTGTIDHLIISQFDGYGILKVQAGGNVTVTEAFEMSIMGSAGSVGYGVLSLEGGVFSTGSLTDLIGEAASDDQMIINVEGGSWQKTGGAASLGRGAVGTGALKLNISSGGLDWTGMTSPEALLIGDVSVGHVVTQTGGTVSIKGSGAGIQLAKNSGSGATYNMSAGVVDIDGDLNVGHASGGVGVLSVSGTSSVMARSLNVNSTGSSATLNGGTVEVDYVNINAGQFGNGTADIGGFRAGTLIVSQTVTVSNGSQFVVGDGTLTAAGVAVLRLSAGTIAHSFSNGLQINTDGQLEGSGVIDGLTTVSGGLSAGTGAAPGEFTFNDGLTLNGTAQITMDITSASFGAGTFDQFSGSSIIFGGVLTLNFQGGGFAPGANVVQLFDFSSYTGSFSSVEATGLAPGQSVLFNNSTGYLTVVPEPQTVAQILVAAGFFGMVVLFNRRKPSAV